MMSNENDSGSLVVNPTLRVKIKAIWNQRGRGARTMTLEASESTDATKLVAFLLQAVLDEGAALRVEPSLHAKLVELGFLVTESDEPGDLVAYSYDLPPVTEELHPYINRVNFDGRVPVEQLVVNPHLKVARGRPDLAHSDFVRDEDIVAWVTDAGTGVSLPYRLGETMAERLESRQGRKLSPADIDTLVPAPYRKMGIELLRRAEILVAPGWEEERRAAWQAQATQLRADLAATGFAVLRGLVNPVQLGFLRRYYRASHLAGAFERDDGQVEDRSVLHNEPMSRFIQHQLVDLINQLVPAPIKASYSYTAVYEPGALLKRHVDRPQCEWNLSMPFDADPETDRETAWPIYLEAEGVAHGVRLELGDGILYRGTDVPHWRDAQAPGHRTTVSFFHFVDQAFDGSLD